MEARSPIDIALVKYWGKAHTGLIIPANDSFSITLSKDTLCSTTIVRLLPSRTGKIELKLNGEVELIINRRISDMIATIRDMVDSNEGQTVPFQGGEVKVADLLKRDVQIDSVNNFATASGMASSSSGLSCLAVVLATCFGLDADKGKLSTLARRGSGSACRSLFGGFVQWARGFEGTQFP